MKKLIPILIATVLAIAPSISRADEGMWLLSLIGKNYADMQKAGFKLTPEDIYQINQSCLKDAIVGLGNEGRPFWHFCTGEIISKEGLISTNHHCGYGKLQEHSTVEHDYLRDGFWAYSKDQELPNPGLTASILIRMEDVTKRVRESLSDEMSEADRNKAIKIVCDEIAAEAVAGTDYNAQVKPMFNGNQFFLFVHIIYKDVRLVGAPPSSMGKFGGDTDNWSWPRHTCDFSMFRIYTAPDGKPAAYSKSNIPLSPKHHLPVSCRELKDGEFSMVMGFPGTTDHFLTSYGLKETMEVTNHLRYNIRSVKINILREEMAASQATKIKYAAKYASCANYWKYSHEQNIALDKLKTMLIKKDIEKEYREWAKDKDPKYAKALDLIEQGYADRRDVRAATTYISEGLLSGPEILLQAYQMGTQLKAALAETDYDTRQAKLNAISQRAEAFYKDVDPDVDQRIMAALLEYVYRNIQLVYCPEYLKAIDKKFNGHFDNYVSNAFGRSIFASQEAFNKFMAQPNAKTLERDELFKAANAIIDHYRELSTRISQESSDGLTRGIRDFVDGILQINEGRKLMAPDANSTIRCTWGNVKSYEPRDGVSYHFYTTLDGVMQKEDTNSTEFLVPQRLKELYANKDFGRYANKEGKLPTCFITNNDITGGNSGSPVIDGNGNLIGLAFDGNGEAMSGDIDFEENLQRCICLDARYMLFVIDKFANAQNLIQEMDIVTR